MPHAPKIALILEMISSAESNLRSAKQMLQNFNDKSVEEMKSEMPASSYEPSNSDEANVVEGLFNGQTMTDNNGKEYPVPANYASKSKLVPGDLLKLTIKPDGGFLYKQIGPIERNRIVGTLTYEDGQYRVIANGKAYKVLLASVTYFKGEIGNKVTLIVPALQESEWGSIENVLPDDATDIES